VAKSRAVEKRKHPRRGLALRVVLRDRKPPVHATTRNLSLGGMNLMTATRKLNSERALTAEIETGRRNHRWTAPLPVRVVWSHDTLAGVVFQELPAEAAKALTGLLTVTRDRRTRPRHPRKRV
jgi:hypothetical protein